MKELKQGIVLKNYFIMVVLMVSLTCGANESEITIDENQPTLDVRVNPKYPPDLVRKSKHGWVQLNFLIDTEGHVGEVIVVDSSGESGFEKAAKAALKKWQYKPAKLAGKPVITANLQVQLNFSIGASVLKGASSNFIAKYKDIRKAFETKDYDSVESGLRRLKRISSDSYYEYTLYKSLQADYYQQIGNKRSELSSLTSIPLETAYAEKLITQAKYVANLARIFQLSVSLNRFVLAQRSYDRIKAVNSTHDYVTAFQPYIEQVQAMIASDTPINVSGELNHRDLWLHRLVRSSFTFKEVRGEPEYIEFRCLNLFERHPFVEEKKWQLPDKPENCSIVVLGDEGSEFTLVELNQPS